MNSTPDVAEVARKLTKAQQRTLGIWPDAWMAASEVMGMRIVGNVASLLADKGMLERRSDPNTWGRSQYQCTPLGLAVRQHLQDQSHDQ